jgi:hypothetical protein
MCAESLGVEKQKVYQIRVQGRLDASWSDWFDGMTLTFEKRGDDSPVTTLTGAVMDQAALHGLLSKISDLNLTLISVTRIE